MLELPSLDDKQYRQILQEALAEIPVLDREWTDHNPQDTGIMLLELLAAMTEMQRFYLDQVGDRFYDRYLALVLPEDTGDAETTDSRKVRFARRVSEPGCAATPGDYAWLAKQSPYGLRFASAGWADGLVRLTVFREGRPLDDAELLGLRRFLEPYRLLGVRLRIRQAACIPVDADCRLAVRAGLVRPDLCRQQAERVIADYLREREPGRALETARLRGLLLAIDGVTGLEALSLRLVQENGAHAEPEQAFLQARRIRVELVPAGEQEGI